MSLLPLDFLAVEEKMGERPTERERERYGAELQHQRDTGKREEIYNAAELKRRNAISNNRSFAPLHMGNVCAV